MNESRAVGGPLAGVKLRAQRTWDGQVARDRTGHYTWHDGAWRWHVDQKPRPVFRKKR